MQYAETVHNAQLNALNDALAAGATFRLFSGTLPHNCEAADSPDGKCLAEGELPLKVFRHAHGGAVELTEPWHFVANKSAGRGICAKHFRVYSSLGDCVIQGHVCSPEDDEPQDLVLDNQTVAAGQRVEIVQFSIKSAWR